MATQPIFPGIIKNAGVSLANADGTTKKILYTAPATGARIDQIRVCSTDTAPQVLAVTLTVDGVDSPLGETQIPAGAGTDSVTPWVEALVDLNRDESLFLAGSVLKISSKSAVTSGKTLFITLFGGEY